ncbi:hypothetical protein M9H77_34718 [Catharanthus roseus]|uniref:Uncharacterized protein n=1 Tax=Catharanthus roseus TaxID=4058 RepID=A0ACB9ZNV2_CATRO|nr:hypothetical protein M9H77_34718 [Catharanthus roseus]
MLIALRFNHRVRDCFPGPSKSNSLNCNAKFCFQLVGDGTFAAGDIAIIKVKVLRNFERANFKNPFNLNITVNNKMGNRKSYIAAGTVSWLAGVDEFIAGTKAIILILPKDAFGNNISSAISASHSNGSVANILIITSKGWNQLGYLSIEFIVPTSGSLLLDVQEQNQTLIRSPLPIELKPGALDVSNCLLRFNHETKSFQLFSVMEAFIHQHDLFGNLVPGLYAFDFEVVEKGTNLSMPVSDLLFKEIGPGVLVIFVPEKSGMYHVSVFCGKIQLNAGVPFRKLVNAGKVNLSLSGLVEYAPKVSKMIRNDIIIASVNSSGFSAWMFGDNNDGRIFPKVFNDKVYVCGSLLIQNGRLFRYTPYKGFYADDSFFNSGYLTASPPSTELKVKTSYDQWQPLETFVSISKHFTVKAKGIRFRGTIADCNTIMQHLLHQGGKLGCCSTREGK